MPKEFGEAGVVVPKLPTVNMYPYMGGSKIPGNTLRAFTVRKILKKNSFKEIQSLHSR
jgi:hypothetical protein